MYQVFITKNNRENTVLKFIWCQNNIYGVFNVNDFWYLLINWSILLHLFYIHELELFIHFYELDVMNDIYVLGNNDIMTWDTIKNIGTAKNS